MTDEGKIIRVNTLKNFDRDGDETLEVPAWIAEQYGFFSEESQRTLRAEFPLVVSYGE